MPICIKVLATTITTKANLAVVRVRASTQCRCLSPCNVAGILKPSETGANTVAKPKPKRNLQSVEQQWQDLAKHVIPTQSPGMPQYDDMRRCFFAGAFCLLMSTKRLGEPDISEDEAFRYLDRIETELVTFLNNIDRYHSERN